MQQLAYATLIVTPVAWRYAGPQWAVFTLLAAVVVMGLLLWMWSFVPRPDPPTQNTVPTRDLRTARILALDDRVRKELADR